MILVNRTTYEYSLNIPFYTKTKNPEIALIKIKQIRILSFVSKI